MTDYIALCQNLRQDFSQLGWDRTEINLHFVFDSEGHRPSSISIYPKATEIADEDFRVEPEWIFSTHFDDPEYLSNRIAEIKRKIGSPKSAKTKKVLEAIATATELSASLGLSADFINPLTAMAEQLRSNILPKP